MLVACQSVQPPSSGLAPVPGVGELADQLDWQGQGSEPFWSLRLSGRTVQFQQPDAGFEREAETVWIETLSEGKLRAVYSSNGAPFLTAVRTAETCIDFASGGPRPYSLSVQTGEQNLKGCGGDLVEFLARSNWLAEDLNGEGVIDRAEPQIRFGSNGAIEVLTGCSRFIGDFKSGKGELVIGSLMRTDEPCQNTASKNQENKLLTFLQDPLRVRSRSPSALIILTSRNGRLILSASVE